MTKQKHTLEERVPAVREHLEDEKSYSELSAQYGTTAQVVRNWVKRYQEMGVAGLEDRRGKRLANQIPRTGPQPVPCRGRFGSKTPVWNVKTIC